MAPGYSKRRRLNRKTKVEVATEEEAKVEEAPAEEAPAEEAPAAEAPAEEATVEAAAAEEASAEDLAWMDEPVEESDSSDDDDEGLDDIQFQYDKCPTEPPHDCNSMQWWFRFLRPWTGPPPPSRWAMGRSQMLQ